MRRSIPVRVVSALFALGLGSLAPQPAAGFGHEWTITEVYSNADGSVQFIEMFVDGSAENLLSFMFLSSLQNAQSFSFPTDLGGSTQNKHLLVATAAFAAQPGAVAPDYVMPEGFLRSAGDELSFWNDPIPFLGGYNQSQAWDRFGFGPGLPALPTDGVSSLHRAFGSATLSLAPNSPTNFAGAVGSLVPEPGTASLLGLGLAGVALGRRRRRAPASRSQAAARDQIAGDRRVARAR